MDFDPAELDTLSREDLILRARARGIERPEQMTRVELRDEIVRLSEPDLERQRRSRGWLGVARDLLASVVESGLNLPDAAAAIRGDAKSDVDLQGPPPVATVTLAEIYATQGHYEQALRMLDEVLQREPEHAIAATLRQRLVEEREQGPSRRRRSGGNELRPQSSAPEPAVAPREAAPQPEPAPAPPAAPAPEPAPQVVVAPEPPVVAAPAPEPPVVAAPAPEPPPVVEAEPVAAPEPAVVSEPEVTAPSEPALLVLHSNGRAFVYWRLPALSDALRVRSVAVLPDRQGATVEEEDHRVALTTGGFWLRRMPPGTEVRAALGELTRDGFVPLTVARVVPSAESEGYEPPGVSGDDELETAARSAAGL